MLICRRFLNFLPQCRNFASHTSTASPIFLQKEKTSKAMKVYLERAKEHEDFMKTQQVEYEIGKRHLANMMGEDPETFTQDDVDKAIEYLFPSGIFEPKARPLMKPPEEIFPKRKAAEFDEFGRPHHSMFFTGRPNFFKLLYDIAEQISEMNNFEDRMIRKQNKPDPNQELSLSGSQWFNKDDLEKVLVETIEDIEYDNFVNAMTRLASLPYSYKVKEFIGSYRKPLIAQGNKYEIPKPQYDEQGRMFVTTYECLRKRARGDVTIRAPGTGKITINGEDINYFKSTQCREQELDAVPKEGYYGLSGLSVALLSFYSINFKLYKLMLKMFTF